MSQSPTCERLPKIERDRLFVPAFAATVRVALVCWILSITSANGTADVEPIAGFQPRVFALTQATIVPVPGKVLSDGTLLIRNGIIIAVGRDITVPAGANVIDGKGLYVYAGFIDAGSTGFLDTESPPTPIVGRKVDFRRYALATTRSDNWKSLTPELHVEQRLQLTPEKLDTARQYGFTAIHVVPSGRIASGQATLITTSGLPIRESVLVRETFSEFQLFAPGKSGYPTTLMGAMAHLRQAFSDSRQYAVNWEFYRKKVRNIARPPVDSAFEMLHAVQSEHKPCLFLANSQDDIHRTLDFCREHNLKPCLWGAKEAAECLTCLAQNKIDLIVQVDFGDEPKVEVAKTTAKLTAEIKQPRRVQIDQKERWQQRIAGLSKLHEHKIRLALSSRNLKNRGELLKGLRLAIERGLDRDTALAMLTIDAARILGIDDRLGTLEPGKLGHLVVMNGPFENQQSQVRYLLVDGQEFEYHKNLKPIGSSQDSQETGLDLAGHWRVRIDSAEGPVVGDLQLSQDGTRLNGVLESDQGNGRLMSGRVTAKNVAFTIAIGAGAHSVQLKFSGTCTGKTLAGTLHSPFGAETQWTAERVDTTPAQSNPVQLSGLGAVAEPVAANGTSKPKDDVTEEAELPTELESDRRFSGKRTGGNLLVVNGTVLTGTGKTLPRTSILIREGMIAAIGRHLQPENGIPVLHAEGRYVIPGIIDSHSHIMIAGGSNESSQSIVPEVRVKDVVRTEDSSEYRALAGGVTAARLLHGSSNVIGGQDAVVKLRYGATAREQIIDDAPQGVKFALGENVKARTTRFPNTRLGVEATLNRAFFEARDYRRRWREYEQQSKNTHRIVPPRRDFRLEVLADILDHKKFMHCHCYRADEILMLLRVASSFDIRVWSLQHVLEGYKVAPEIAAHGASCSTFSDWWAYKMEAYDATPYNAALLHEAGVNTVIKSDNAELMRHLYSEAAKTVRYGNVSLQDALQMITLNPARELGLDRRMGSLEVGKDGDLAIFSGHPLNAFSRCEQTIIGGEIYFQRKRQPSAMSPEAARRSDRPAKLRMIPKSSRERTLDMSRSSNGIYAIVHATVHPVDQPDMRRVKILIQGGQIVGLGRKIAIPEEARIIDAAGLHVYPGMIDAGTTLGLTEIGKVVETHDYSESGLFQPDVRAGVAINPDSELIPVARTGGITTVLIRPTGGIIAGQASIAQLAGWTASEMTDELEAGLQINWPSDKKSPDRVDQLRDFLHRARLYDSMRTAQDAKDRNLVLPDPRFEVLRPYLHGKKPVFVEANSRKQITEALLFAEKEALRIIITGGTDAWKMADELKTRNVPVIVGPVMRKPVADYDPFDAPYANPGRLFDAGVTFCIRSNSSTNSRNTPFEAAMAVAYGLPEKEALKAVTLSPAKILGIDDRVGSITVGKQANLVITDGSPLQQTTQIKGIFVAGKPFAAESRHTRLYKRYRSRLLEVQQNHAADSPAAKK